MYLLPYKCLEGRLWRRLVASCVDVAGVSPVRGTYDRPASCRACLWSAMLLIQHPWSILVGSLFCKSCNMGGFDTLISCILCLHGLAEFDLSTFLGHSPPFYFFFLFFFFLFLSCGLFPALCFLFMMSLSPPTLSFVSFFSLLTFSLLTFHYVSCFPAALASTGEDAGSSAPVNRSPSIKEEVIRVHIAA